MRAGRWLVETFCESKGRFLFWSIREESNCPHRNVRNWSRWCWPISVRVGMYPGRAMHRSGIVIGRIHVFISTSFYPFSFHLTLLVLQLRLSPPYITCSFSKRFILIESFPLLDCFDSLWVWTRFTVNPK